MSHWKRSANFSNGSRHSFSASPALLYKPRYRTEVWTYSHLWEQSTRIAWWLHDRGIARGDRVVIWAPNSPWWVAAFFGLERVGAVCVPLDIRSSPDFVRNVLAQVGTEIRAGVCPHARRLGAR